MIRAGQVVREETDNLIKEQSILPFNTDNAGARQLILWIHGYYTILNYTIDTILYCTILYHIYYTETV